MNDVPEIPDRAGRDEDDVATAPRGRFPTTLAVVLAAALLAGVLLAVTDVPTFTVIGSIVLFLVIVRVGWFFLQQFATPPPPPPDPGTLRRVRLTYRCPVCGAEVRMTSAATEDPEPPRHCMEEMDLVSSEE
jgi:hypothetical protein